MRAFRFLLIALLSCVTVTAAMTSGSAADKAVIARSPPPSPGPSPVPGPGPGPPLEVCKHASPTLPPQQKCVGEVMYRLCGCNNSCTIQFGRPPGNTDPHWDPKPLNKCKGDCGRVAGKEQQACFRP